MSSRLFSLLVALVLFVASVPQPVQGQGDSLSLEHGGITRTYNVHLPPGYSPQVPMPVVIYLHGGGGSIAAAYKDKMDQESDRLGFILLIPAGTGPIPNRFLTWNNGTISGVGCCAYAYEHNIDDVGFISQMIDQVKAKFAVDAKRIYVAGISNGAAMAYLIGCELPDKIAAVAAVASGGVPDACSSSRPMSIIYVHGTGDPLVPYNGGTGGILFPNSPGGCIFPKKGNARGRCPDQSTEAKVDFWVKKDQCALNPERVYQSGAATCVSYNRCASGTEVEFCKIEGGGHTWPSGNQYLSASKIGPVSYDISFVQIWNFLKKHALQK
jgi:polyhydroxybutyrate depolymerase